MNNYDYCLRTAFLEAAEIGHWNAPYAVTLTMKQAIKRDHFTIRLDPLKASMNLRHFLNLLNGKIFSSGDLRRGHSIRCIPVLEDGERYHYHLCLDRPAHVSEIVFMNLIYDCWPRTDFGYWMIEITTADAGWVRYMAKGRSKRVFADAIDWENFHNPD